MLAVAAPTRKTVLSIHRSCAIYFHVVHFYGTEFDSGNYVHNTLFQHFNFFLHEKEEALKFAGPDPFVPEIDERPDGEGCHRIFKERVLPLALLSVS